jgi:GTP-sensing pleiotropic transcriptional regulator CodY
MSTDLRAVDEVKEDLATAVGLFVLSDCTLPEAADRAGVTRWEVENALETAGLAEQFGIETDEDVAGQIDDLLDRE